jgi:thiamine-monophosphate kinase
MERLGEFALIERFFSRSLEARVRPDVVLGVGDDAALLRVPPGADLVAAVDTLVAGRHFPWSDAARSDARSIGHRALAVNLSDLAAMGATPAWATLALTLPTADATWLEGFASGLWTLADEHGVALVGGDTTAGPLTISLQLMGHVSTGTALRRSGAQAGDLLVVTGTLGDAGAGLEIAMAGASRSKDARASGGRAGAIDSAAAGEDAGMIERAAAGEDAGTIESGAAGELLGRFEYPTPRVAFGGAARGIAHAAMDLSDGLVGDLPKLAAASGVAAHVDVGRLPISTALASRVPAARARDLALSAGDDYELMLAVAPARLDELAAIAHQLNLTLTVIGDLRRGSGVTFTLDGAEFRASGSGYDHFR